MARQDQVEAGTEGSDVLEFREGGRDIDGPTFGQMPNGVGPGQEFLSAGRAARHDEDDQGGEEACHLPARTVAAW